MTDLRYAFRQFAKSPGFTLMAVLSLALGIGANTALFSLVDDVLLHSLPVKKPNELVLFHWLSGPKGLFNGISGNMADDPATGLKTSTSLSYFIFERLRDQSGPLSDIFAFARLESLNVTVDHQSEIIQGQVVTGGYFSGLGVRASRGRLLTADDDRPDASPVAVISHAFWQRRFGGADNIIGRTIRVNRLSVTIVGITAQGFNGALEVGQLSDLSLPMAFAPHVFQHDWLHDPLTWWLHIMGRLQPGVTAAQAHAQLEPVFVQAARDGVAVGEAKGPDEQVVGRSVPRLRLEPGGQGLLHTRRSYAQPLHLLMGIVSLVLLIACTNVANLLLARAAAREKEIAVRLSVGAGRWRIMRQLLVESLLLAAMGGGLGVILAFWGRDMLLQLRSYGVSGPLELNVRVLAFTVSVCIGTGLLFGLVPAWRATGLDLNSVLKKGSGATGRSRFAARRVFMVLQIALSVVLLFGAGLFLRTLHNLRAADAGFNRENLVLFDLKSSSLEGYSSPQVVALYDRLLERLQVLPGVRSVTLSNLPSLRGAVRQQAIVVNHPRVPLNQVSVAAVNVITPTYFSTMEIPLLLGRNFNPGDQPNAPRSAVVNETFVRMFLTGGNPIGQTISFGTGFPPPLTIIGVVRDARYANFRQAIPPTIYLSFYQEIIRNATFAVRTHGDTAATLAAIHLTLHNVAPTVPFSPLRTQSEQIDQLVSQERLFATLSTFFGLIALVLTCIGLYGLLAYDVTSRTREIGIRLALGAQLRAVTALVLKEGLKLTALGVGIGLTVALALVHLVAHLLFEVPSVDPISLSAASFILLAVALVACWLPARRASRVDPMVALRAE